MAIKVRALREFWCSIGFAERNFMLVKRYAGWEAVFLTYTVVSALTTQARYNDVAHKADFIGRTHKVRILLSEPQ